jgi:hypothetical protein
MRKMLINQIVKRNPTVEGFVSEVSSKFGVRLDHEQVSDKNEFGST